MQKSLNDSDQLFQCLVVFADRKTHDTWCQVVLWTTEDKRQVKDQEDSTPSRDDAAALFGSRGCEQSRDQGALGQVKNESDKGAWKQSSEALDMIQSICERAGLRHSLHAARARRGADLKARLCDANANLKVKVANVLETVATSVGPDIAKMSKLLRPSLIAGVADNKKAMQDAAMHALRQ
ncbi:hypothetical protein PsorP6_012984 [Peronosclerospora sorghi]|uniref:Uncharacterized protein n=1 Tax=Peronosclerospora sorghi TaxID=230839 RepID=A0ACC0WFJ7_9STRA|nr:hypothetical protein PsorP6_012984 [Peronosclerospora sorghi]